MRGRVAAILLAIGGGGCLSEDWIGEGDVEPQEQLEQQCFDYTRWDGTSPSVALETDLLGDQAADGTGGGFLRRACGFSTCHGNLQKPAAGLFLGPPLFSFTDPIQIIPEEIAAVLANLIRRPSQIAPALNRVVPGDPQNSFLMIKVDGCFTPIAAQCENQLPGSVTDHRCGDVMPRGGQPLVPAERDTLRRWISQLTE